MAHPAELELQYVGPVSAGSPLPTQLACPPCSTVGQQAKDRGHSGKGANHGALG